MVAGTLASGAQASRPGRFTLVCGCFLEFGLPALGKTFEYSLQMLVRSVVQSDFRYSSAKVAKTAEMYVFTRRKYCTKILENIYAISFCTTLEKILLLIPLRLKRVDLSLGSRENSHRRFVYYFCHTLMEIAVFIK